MILVGTTGGLHLLDAGPVGPGGNVTALASTSTRTWAVENGGALHRSEDPKTWSAEGSFADLSIRCLLPDEAGVLAGTAEAGLYRLADGRAARVEGFDRVEGRQGWYTPWGGAPDTRSIDRGAGGRVYANVHVGGIVRSDDGERWEPTIEIDRDVHQVVAHPDREGVVLAACAYGLAASHDGGDSWDISAEGLHGAYCRAVASNGDLVFVSASTGPFTDRAAVYRRALDGGRPFERCEKGLPEWFTSNVDSHCLIARGDRVAFGTDAGEVWDSGDGGRSWDRAAAGLEPVTCLAFAGA